MVDVNWKSMVTTVPDLQLIAFSNIIQRIWKHSDLPQICIDLNSLNSIGAYSDNRKRHKIVLKSLQDAILQFNCFPKLWRMNLASALEALDYELRKWADQLVTNLCENMLTTENVAFCCNNIVFCQDGQLDNRQTILNIILESQFKIMFKSTLLAYYCIDKKTMRELTKEYFDKITSTGMQLRCRNNGNKKRKVLCLDGVESIKKIAENMLKVDQFWIISWIRSDDRTSIGQTTLYQHVASKKIITALRYFYNFMDRDEKIIRLFESLKYLFHCHLLSRTYGSTMVNAEILVFFYEHLDKETWEELLERNFSTIFFSLLTSWRHRDLCLKFYNDVKHLLDVQTHREILSCLLMDNDFSVYDYYLAMNVIVKVWKCLPEDFKDNHEICTRILPSIVTSSKDYENLSIILLDYNNEKRKEIIGIVLLHFMSKGEFGEFSDCIKKLNEYGINVDINDLFNMNILKEFLIIHYCERKRVNRVYNTVTCFVYKTNIEKDTFKEYIFSDNKFMIKFLTYICKSCEEYFLEEFLDWGFSGERMIKRPEFKKRMQYELISEINKNVITDAELLQYVSEQSLNNINVLDNSCKFYKASEPEDKLSILQDTAVLRCALTSVIKGNNYSGFRIHSSKYISNDKVAEFLLSDEALQLILNRFVLYLNSVEQENSLGTNPYTLTDSYFSFKNKILNYYGAAERFDRKLEEYGHPNLRNHELLIRNRFKLRPHEVFKARKQIDAQYRMFRVVLRTQIELLSEVLGDIRYNDDMTLFSLSMASFVGMNIPCVL